MKKLLEAIRTGKAAQISAPVKSHTAATKGAGRPAPSGGSIIAASKKITLGVDICRSEARLVKVTRISSDRWQLLDCVSIPFGLGISRGAARFHEFLRSSVSPVAGLGGKCEVWTQISPANLDVRYIKIPRVPRAQIPNAVYWTAKREANFDEKESIIDFEVRGDLLEDGIAKIGVMAYILPGKDLEEMRDIFSRSGLSLSGITVAPFSIQNLFRSGCVSSHDKPVGVLYIGDQHSRIDVFLKENLVLTRYIKAGIDSMVEALAERAYEERWKVAALAGEESLTALQTEAGNGRKEVEALLAGFFSGSFSPGTSTGSTVPGEEAVLERISPALGRLARQVERTLEYYSVTLKNEKVDTIYVSCEAGHWERLFDFIPEQLGLKREVLDPLDQGAILSDIVPGPAGIAKRSPFTAAIGIALSDNVKTPNLLFRYKDKEKVSRIARINRGIFCAAFAILLVLTGVLFWQAHLSGQKETEVARLQQELEGYNPRPNRNTIAALAATVIAGRRALAERSGRLLPVAVIGELASLTPPNVRLVFVRADLGSKPIQQDSGSASGGVKKEPAGVDKETKRSLVLEGIVTGRRDTQEASLAGYLMKLSASPIFVHPVVNSSVVESNPDGVVLRFSLQMGLP